VGRWTVRKYKANDGTNRIVNECIVENVTVFNRQPKQENNTYIPEAYTQPQYEELKPDQDLPF